MSIYKRLKQIKNLGKACGGTFFYSQKGSPAPPPKNINWLTLRISLKSTLVSLLTLFFCFNIVFAPQYLYAAEGLKEGVYTSYHRSWKQLKGVLKDAFAPRYHVRKNFFGVHYKNFILGDTLRFKDEEFSVKLSDIHSSYNAWGVFYVNLRDRLRTRIAASFYEYQKLNYSYVPRPGSSATVDQIKITEGDFSLAYVFYVNPTLPLYAGGGLTAGHMKIQNSVRYRELALGYVGLKMVLGASYIFDDTLLLDAGYHSVPLGMNQGFATTISAGLPF